VECKVLLLSVVRSRVGARSWGMSYEMIRRSMVYRCRRCTLLSGLPCATCHL
jgi:hypothetical protein